MTEAGPAWSAQAAEPAASEGASLADGPPPARPGGRRPRSPWRVAFFALLAVTVLAGVGYALLGDRLLVIRSVTVTGTHLVTPAQVRAAADVAAGTPLLEVDTSAVAARVAAIRQVASVTVTPRWPDGLAIAVTERVPAMAVRMAGGGYDLIDHDGVIVRWAKAKPAGLPEFVTSLTGREMPGDPGVVTATAVLAELQPSLARSVATVSVAGEPTGVGAAVGQAQQVTLFLRDHKTVRWGGTDRAPQKNRELVILLRGTARYIDVSAPGIVVTR